ncbi:MAG: Outer membrane lipoprotein-sorting protein [Firmicutes bacterium]|nr:Outer membrane lipoprotein-sorting protein [Bacillota bacterium]
MICNFTDDMLREAVIKADIRELEALPADHEIEHEFSNKFQRKMRKLIRRSKTGSPTVGAVFLRRRAVALVAAIIILLASAMSVSAVRAAVFEFIAEVYEKFTHIFFNESRSFQDAADGFAIYEPTYIPEGFKLVNKNTDGFVLLEYEKGDDFISYSQQRLENVSMNINTEGVELEELEFKGLSAKYYSNQGVQNLLWYDDKYMYMVSSTLDRDIMFKIAESIEITDTDLSP